MTRLALASVALALATVASGLSLAPEPVKPSGLLAELAFERGTESNPCPGAPTRSFDVVALQIPISYNHWGDFDPHGRLFVLASQEQELRDQVAGQLAKAGFDTVARVVRAAQDEQNPFRLPGRLLEEAGVRIVGPSVILAAPNLEPFDVSPLAQPFIVRAHVGDCVQLNLTNKLPEPVSLHVHRAAARPGQGMALGADEPDLTLPGQTRSYVVYIPPLPGMEGAHYLHSHADARFHTRHGLFGAIVAEPQGSSWLDPDGGPSVSGQEAIIAQPGAGDFREYVVILHDEVELVNRNLNPLPTVDNFKAYGPGTKSINLRTEPFMDRFEHHDRLSLAGELARPHDKSQGYGSYTYGDPAHFLPRAYVGDPTKFRLLNAGPGQHHVFHLHGGGDRWRASPVSDDTQFDDGLLKTNPVVQSPSERIDVQSVGPGESFNLEIEGGAGGVQQSVGDFLYHCHIVEHYVAGMFAFWRVYNTLQPGLAELPDRAGRVAEGVNSTGLVGKRLPDGTLLDPDNVRPWIEGQLPPQGVPGENDASVWDWEVSETSEGPLYKGEPETDIAWPNYRSPAPGQRPELLFNPLNGRLAWPFLSPHFGQRPPFAPAHGPAPYLSLEVDARHPDGLCPPGARPLLYKVVALSVPVAYNAHGDVDQDGQVFVHAEDKAAILAGTKPAKNLILRANQGDCVDVLFTSQLRKPGGGEDPDSKVNMHIHLVQFDVQASDGVITGRNYEQSVRPARAALGLPDDPSVPTVARVVRLVGMSQGQTVLEVDSVAPFLDGSDPPQPKLGSMVGVGLTEPTVELAPLAGVDSAASTIMLGAELSAEHDWADELAGYEFVRYRWYPDVELGMVYWHDHVNGLESWRHGLFGGLVVEPHGSQWRDPKTGLERREGTLVDIVGPRGNYRELVVEFQDRSWAVDGRDLASFNLRSEPFDKRTTGNPLSSAGNGEPATDILRAYPGDPVVIRLLYGANANTRAVGTFALTGHRFAFEQHNPGSRLVDALSFGISAQHNLRVDCGAGGCAKLAGDYLYYMTQPDLFRRGAWGVLRVHDALQADLLPLPGFENFQAGQLPSGPVRRYDLVALETTVLYNQRFNITNTTKLFALASDEEGILNGTIRPMPLVLRALPGEVVEVQLTNKLDEPVSLHAGLVLASPDSGLGIPVGRNPDTTVPPGGTRTYRWHADVELGAAYLTSFGDPAEHALDGLYGALVVEPAGSSFGAATGMSADLTLPDGSTAREHVLLYASDDPAFQSSVMPYSVDVKGNASVNYRTEPLAARLGGRAGPVTGGGEPVGGLGVHTCQLFPDSCNIDTALKGVRFDLRHPMVALVHSGALGTPETPLLDAGQGQRLVVRSLGGAGDQLQVHSLAGHWWPRDPAMPGSDLVDSFTLGPREVSNAWTIAGPGGAGDYLWGSHREAFREAGAWGLLRVS